MSHVSKCLVLPLIYFPSSVPEVYLKMFEKKEQSDEQLEVAMAWEEEEKAEESALQKQQTQAVDEDGESGESEEDEESSATRSSTFVSSFVFFSALVCLVFG